MVKAIIIKDTMIQGSPVKAGERVEVLDGVFTTLLASGKARKAIIADVTEPMPAAPVNRDDGQTRKHYRR